MFLEIWEYFIIEDMRCCNRYFCDVELGKRNFSVDINKRLLVDATNAFEAADIKRILRSQIARGSLFYLTACYRPVSFFSRAATWESVNRTPSFATFSSSAFNRFFEVFRLCLTQIERTPDSLTRRYLSYVIHCWFCADHERVDQLHRLLHVFCCFIDSVFDIRASR